MKRRTFVRNLGASVVGVSGVGSLLADEKRKKRKRKKHDEEDEHDEHDEHDEEDDEETDEEEEEDNNPAQVSGDTEGHVVVVGGGMAGATVAKYLRLWGGLKLRVTLIERESSYVSNIMSNLVLNGSRSIGGLTYSYDALEQNYGIDRVVGEVVSISPGEVSIYPGTIIKCDRIVVAPGIEMDVISGLENASDQARFPHAWKAGVQTTTLRNQIRAMNDGEVFVMTIPKAPYRCPPGPYERACVVADYLKKNRSGCKVLVLDANPDIIAERENFTHAFNVTHGGVIDYMAGTEIKSIDPVNRSVATEWGKIYGNVINPIPPQSGGKLLADNNLLDIDGKWTDVNVLNYETKKMPGVHVIGDSAGTTQPKAGHIANVEAKVCADAIIRSLNGQEPFQSPVTNSACYSPITSDTATWLTAVFGYDAVTETMKVVPSASGASRGASRKNYGEMGQWFGQLMDDSFA